MTIIPWRNRRQQAIIYINCFVVERISLKQQFHSVWEFECWFRKSKPNQLHWKIKKDEMILFGSPEGTSIDWLILIVCKNSEFRDKSSQIERKRTSQYKPVKWFNTRWKRIQIDHPSDSCQTWRIIRIILSGWLNKILKTRMFECWM